MTISVRNLSEPFTGTKELTQLLYLCRRTCPLVQLRLSYRIRDNRIIVAPGANRMVTPDYIKESSTCA